MQYYSYSCFHPRGVGGSTREGCGASESALATHAEAASRWGANEASCAAAARFVLAQPSHSFLCGRCVGGIANHSRHAAVCASTPRKRGGTAAAVAVLWWCMGEGGGGELVSERAGNQAIVRGVAQDDCSGGEEHASKCR